MNSPCVNTQSDGGRFWEWYMLPARPPGFIENKKRLNVRNLGLKERWCGIHPYHKFGKQTPERQL